MIYPSIRYRDPLDQLLYKENQSCDGCRHLQKWLIGKDEKKTCAKGKRAYKKCSFYSEVE